MKRTTCALLLIVLFQNQGCKNHDKPVPSTLTAFELLLGTWAIDSSWQNGKRISLPFCAADDVERYLENGTGMQFYGAVKCASEVDYAFAWKLIEDQKVMQYIRNSDTVLYTLEELNTEHLQYSTTLGVNSYQTFLSKK